MSEVDERTSAGPAAVGIAGSPDHLDAVLRRTAARHGDRPALTFVPRRGGAGSTTLTYGEVDHRARAVAAVLQASFSAGSRVALACPHDAGYATAFLGCLYAGMVAVPLYAPEPFRKPDRLLAALADCAPAALLTTSGAAASVENAVVGNGHRPAPLIEVDTVPVAAAADFTPVRTTPESTAYLQYTSGSTGSPAGVRITHANLAAAVHQLRSHFPHSRTVASWVPFFHDMGLVYGLMMPLGSGAHSVQSSPMGFVHDPFQWLEAISGYRADWTVTPNFGLAHCLRRADPERLRALDLGSLRALAVAGEPVHPATVDEFTEVFAPAGLDPRALAPCYGLAEATLAVTATPLGRGPRSRTFDRAALADGRVRPVGEGAEGGARLSSCGTPKAGVSVVIADPGSGRELGADRVGEIWVRGPNVAGGYWQRPDRTARRFASSVDLEDGAVAEGPWLRTEDLGFHHEGGLYVAGRIDDLIIVRGRNHYPEDIESDVRAAVPCTAAAFAVDEGGEQRFVVLVEPLHPGAHASAGDRAAVTDAVRRAVTAGHGITPEKVVLVRRGGIPRTTSGKIQRSRCREDYRKGLFPPART